MASISNRDDVISLPRSEWRDWTGTEEALSQLARANGAAPDEDAPPAVDWPDQQPVTVAESAPPRRRRPLRALLRYAAAVFIGVVGTLAWQSHGETAKHMAGSAIADVWQSYGEPVRQTMAGWTPNVWLTSSSGAAPQHQPAPPGADQPATPAAAPEPVDTRAAAEPRNWEALASDLAGLRKTVEQIAANQDRMGRDLAKLQAPEPGPRQAISIPTPSPTPSPTQSPTQTSSQAAAAQSRRPAPPPPAPRGPVSGQVSGQITAPAPAQATGPLPSHVSGALTTSW